MNNATIIYAPNPEPGLITIGTIRRILHAYLVIPGIIFNLFLVYWVLSHAWQDGINAINPRPTKMETRSIRETVIDTHVEGEHPKRN